MFDGPPPVAYRQGAFKLPLSSPLHARRSAGLGITPPNLSPAPQMGPIAIQPKAGGPKIIIAPPGTEGQPVTDVAALFSGPKAQVGPPSVPDCFGGT